MPVWITEKNRPPSSDFKGTSSYDDVIALASKSFGEDKQGYRREFVRLVEAVKLFLFRW